MNAGVGNAYAFNITQAKGAVAYEYQSSANNYQLYVLYGTQSELVAQGPAICQNQGQTAKTLTGSLVGVGASDFATISLGGSAASVFGGSGSTFTLNNVPTGNQDLVATKSTINLTTGALTFVNMSLRRNVNLANNAVISPAIDLSAGSTEAFTLTSRNVQLLNLLTDQALLYNAYQTANGGIASLFTESVASNTTARTYLSIPAVRQVAGDLHYLGAYAATTFSSTILSERFVASTFNAGADKTLTFGAVPNAVAASTLSASAPVRLRAATTTQADYSKSFFANFSQAGANPRSVSIQISAGWQGTATALNFDVPDLAAAGYTPSWGLQPLVLTSISTSVSGWSASSNNPLVEGGTFMIGIKNLSITP